MKLVNQLAKLPEMSQTMQQMSMEMTKVPKKMSEKKNICLFYFIFTGWYYGRNDW